jgi:hypothetical protein
MAFVSATMNLFKIIVNFMISTVLSCVPWNQCSNYDEFGHHTQAHFAVSRISLLMYEFGEYSRLAVMNLYFRGLILARAAISIFVVTSTPCVGAILPAV